MNDADRLAIDTIRTLSIDGVEAANSGHPGMPMAMAPAAFLLYARIMKHDPADPQWPDRDRFVLSAGHGSMLLYSTLHLAGYDVTLDDLKGFRSWESKTPGHPERDTTNVTPGVEVTTGPLGQGFANGVGMAMAEQYLRERYGAEVQDHHVYAIVSDGDMQEGISHEAAALAGHLGLGKLVYLYDDNDIQLDGPTSETFSEDVSKRFEAYGWHVEQVADVNDLETLEAAIQAGIAETAKPTLIRVKTIIGWPAPNKQGTQKAHGSPLGEDETRLAKEALGWDPDAKFLVPDGVIGHFGCAQRGAAARAEWQTRFDAFAGSDADRAAEWELAWASPAQPLEGLREALDGVDWGGKEALATRKAGQKAMELFEAFTPTMVGGAADLSGSTNTLFPESGSFDGERAGRNVKFGVREHGMGGAVNGMAAHGGILRPYGSTFLQFSDYMRGSVRLSALMGLEVAWVYTHDSIGLGEDGPTHQPVEHLAALRAIPGLTVWRPGDANETAAAWYWTLADVEGPAAFALSRQDLPILPEVDFDGVGRGAYVLREADGGAAQLVLVATGGEVKPCLEARDLLQADGIPTRLVSMPSQERFLDQEERYRDDVLPPATPKLSVEAAVSMGWARFADASVALDRFGASAPASELFEHFGFTGPKIAQRARSLVHGRVG